LTATGGLLRAQATTIDPVHLERAKNQLTVSRTVGPCPGALVFITVKPPLTTASLLQEQSRSKSVAGIAKPALHRPF
jgi:hypothetical protein